LCSYQIVSSKRQEKQQIMIYKALSSFTETLLSRPEAGMGYQRIEAKRTDRYATQKYIVYNADLIVELNESFQ
jgi:hypothetical protein